MGSALVEVHEEGVRQYKMEVFVEDLIDDRIVFSSFLEVGYVVCFYFFDEVFHEFTVLEVVEDLIFEVALFEIVIEDEFVIDDVSVVDVIDIDFEGKFHELEVESFDESKLAGEALDYSEGAD